MLVFTRMGRKKITALLAWEALLLSLAAARLFAAAAGVLLRQGT